jgi:putative hydrolase of the HAD superfamily
MLTSSALLVDLDGVLRRWPAHDHDLERSFGLPPGELRRVAFAPDLLALAITGAVTDEGWRSTVGARLALHHPAANTEAAVRAWSQSSGEVAADVLQVLKSEAGELPLILVTNATSRLHRDLQALGLADSFLAVVNSSVVGVAKPDPAIFKAALQAAGCSAEEALFVDDSASNVQAAQALGIRGHTYESPESLSEFLRVAVRRNAA